MLCFQFFGLGILCASALASTLVCLKGLDEGSGQENTLRFRYDHQLGFCVPFFYKGEGGNGNNFPSDKECMASCSSSYQDLYPEGEAVCSLKMDPGTCFAHIGMYYYDGQEKNCRMFIYRGCQGNGNRFETREDCHQTCQSRSGRLLGTAPNPDEQTVNVGLIVGVLGGVVFAVAVIATVALLVVQRKAKRADRKKVPTNDVELS